MTRTHRTTFALAAAAALAACDGSPTAPAGPAPAAASHEESAFDPCTGGHQAGPDVFLRIPCDDYPPPPPTSPYP